jgi:hypothetical protein
VSGAARPPGHVVAGDAVGAEEARMPIGVVILAALAGLR